MSTSGGSGDDAPADDESACFEMYMYYAAHEAKECSVDEFTTLVHTLAPYLRAIALRLCRDRADADDLLQDTFERALRRWDRFEKGSNARAWLTTIMYHLFIDRCRKQGRTPRMEAISTIQLVQPSSEPQPVWIILTPGDLKAALLEIGAPYREVFELHEFARLPYEKIAGRLGISPNTVGTRLHRARRKLRAVLMKLISHDAEEGA
jgi:RNA polymerase sigma-70 factor (ECF subfamily)